MFERYTERARRVLFFSRYEASQVGGLEITLEHLLLGLFREGGGLASELFAHAQVPIATARRELEALGGGRDKISTSIEIPFSAETKRVLYSTATEADRLSHAAIGPEHLLLAILSEPQTAAAMLLDKYGMRLDTVRADVIRLVAERERSSEPGGAEP